MARYQIQACLRNPTVWKFVGFASAIVGLLCYALSSSFNSLFGKWKLWKAFLYCVFSFIICIVVFFAKGSRRSSSLQSKAHMAFFVLTITSFYSFFFDKAVTKKPDAYSVVSCAAFAVMSLSLSRPTIDCGSAVDLLNFFLGALIVQLMKINWLLGIVGAGFSYSLVILRSSLEPLPEANGYAEPPDQHQVVVEVGSLHLQSNASSVSASVVIQQEDNTQDQEIIQDNAGINPFMPQLLAAIKALEEKNLLLIRLLPRTPGESLERDDNWLIDNLPSDIINNLHEAMKPAVADGLEEECCHLYSSCRKDFLRQCLSALNLQILIDDDYANVGTTTERISSWLRASKIVFDFVFPNEQRLCDRVFSGLWLFGDQSFMQICKETAIRLLTFPRTFVMETSRPMICREVVEMLRTLQGIIPQLELLFHDQEVVTLSNEAATTRERLVEAIRDVFEDMDNLIHCDTKDAVVPGGIYPIAHDVVECLRGVNKVRPMIERVWEEYHMVSNTEGTSPSFLHQVARILVLLDSHLEARSKRNKIPALCYVSMINNALYINEVSIYIYHPMFKMLPSRVRQNLGDYLGSWNKLLSLLHMDNEGKSVASGVAAGSMEQNLRSFNTQFEKMSSTQSKWFASGNIKKQIISTLEITLLPAYENFIGRFQDVLGKRAEQCIQFGISEIKDRLSGMFLGGNPTLVGMETEPLLIESVPETGGRVSRAEVLELALEPVVTENGVEGGLVSLIRLVRYILVSFLLGPKGVVGKDILGKAKKEMLLERLLLQQRKRMLEKGEELGKAKKEMLLERLLLLQRKRMLEKGEERLLLELERELEKERKLEAKVWLQLERERERKEMLELERERKEKGEELLAARKRREVAAARTKNRKGRGGDAAARAKKWR